MLLAHHALNSRSNPLKSEDGLADSILDIVQHISDLMTELISEFRVAGQDGFELSRVGYPVDADAPECIFSVPVEFW